MMHCRFHDFSAMWGFHSGSSNRHVGQMLLFCKIGYWMDNKHILYGRQPLLFILPLILIEDNDLNYCFALNGSTLFSSKYLT